MRFGKDCSEQPDETPNVKNTRVLLKNKTVMESERFLELSVLNFG